MVLKNIKFDILKLVCWQIFNPELIYIYPFFFFCHIYHFKRKCRTISNLMHHLWVHSIEKGAMWTKHAIYIYVIENEVTETEKWASEEDNKDTMTFINPLIALLITFNKQTLLTYMIQFSTSKSTTKLLDTQVFKICNYEGP